jgi:hypothetical protein
VVTSPPLDVWVHPALEVARSRIAGEGLFTTVDLRKDELLMRLGGRLVSTEELGELIIEANASGRYVDTLMVFEDRHLVLPVGTVAHFANHSCDPNLWHVGPYDIRARRSIASQTELTIDYATNSGLPDFELLCRCGAGKCRTRVTGNDWQLPELQHRYEGHWVPALQRRIAAGNAARRAK